MRVLVTGAAGFVGRHLCPALEAAGHDVARSDRETDVTDAHALERAIGAAEPDAIVHLAALSSVADSLERPADAYRINFLGARALLLAARAQARHARILLVGSADVYTATSPQPHPLRESTPQTPRSPYARSKAAAEALGREAARQGQDVVCVRAFNHAGPGQSDRFVVSSFARQVAAIAAGRSRPRLVVGNLDSIRDFLHVADVVDAYLRLLERHVPPDVYHVAGSIGFPIRVVLERLLALARVEAGIEVDPARHRPTDWLVGDATRLREATGWRPRIGLDALLEASLRDWQARDAEPER